MNSTYAGFWLRFAAYLIDSIIVYTAKSFVLVPILGVFGISFASTLKNTENLTEAEAIGLAGGFMAFIGVAWILTTAIAVLYGSLMEASKYQATVGKLALGLMVTDVDGNKLDMTKAIVRNLCKILSGAIMLIGFIIAAFTEKRQGLHDIIAGTLVMKK